MKWDTIKDRCIKEVYKQFKNPSFLQTVRPIMSISCIKTGENPRECTLELRDEIIKCIESWDIRGFNALQRVFPKQFPSGSKRRIELTEKGWEILP